MPSDQLLAKTLGEEFACTGEWWIQNGDEIANPKSTHTGTLTFTRGKGITLDIMGVFERNESTKGPFPFDERSYDMIWGRSTEAELITLYKCQWAGGSSGSFSSSSYGVQAVFASKDVWWEPNEKIAFKSLNLEYTHLDEWIGENAIKSHVDSIDGKFKVDISAETIDKLPRVNVGDYVMSAYVGVGVKASRVPKHQEIVEQAPIFHVESATSSAISIDEVRTIVGALQNLLSLLMYDEPIYPIVIEGSVPIAGDVQKSATMRLLHEPVGTRHPSDKLGNILFSLREVEDFWGDALKEIILAEKEGLKPVFNQFFAEHFSPSPFVEDRFMATIRTIEAFHRRTLSVDYYMKKMEYENKLLDKFLQPVKDAHLEQSFTESLKNRLKYGYQYSLRKRLDQLLDSPNGEEFLTLFVAKDGENEKQKIATETSTASEKDQKLMQWMKNYREAFVEKTVKTRNWYTHFDEDDRSQAVTDGLELEFLNRKLRLFLAALLLGQLHAPPEEVKSKFHHHKFSYLRNAQ